MRYLIATSDRQLGLCLRMLHTQGIGFIVDVDKTEKGKTIFKVRVRSNKEKFEEVSKLYYGLIS